MYPAGNDVLHAGIQNLPGMGMGPFGRPYQRLAGLWLNGQVVVWKMGRTAIFDIVQIGHPGEDTVQAR